MKANSFVPVAEKEFIRCVRSEDGEFLVRALCLSKGRTEQFFRQDIERFDPFQRSQDVTEEELEGPYYS